MFTEVSLNPSLIALTKKGAIERPTRTAVPTPPEKIPATGDRAANPDPPRVAAVFPDANCAAATFCMFII